MKEIENIFSKSAIQVDREQNKIPIIVDIREKQSLVYSNLIGQKANARFEKLEIGDYLIRDIILERKTFSDFQASIIDKRIFNQLIELNKYEKRFLILEGFLFDYGGSRLHENALRGMILSCIAEFNVPIIYTKNEEDSAKFLISLAKRLDREKKENSIRFKKSEMTLDEQKQFVLEGFPGIGPTTAKELIGEFKTLKKIFNAKEKDLEKINLMDENKLKKFKEILEK